MKRIVAESGVNFKPIYRLNKKSPNNAKINKKPQTGGSFAKYVQSVYKHDPFHLFSTEHVVTLAIIALLAILLFLFQERVKQPRASRSVRTSLPLQLSDLSVYLSAIMLVTKSRKLFVFLFFAGIGSSIQALATPDLGMFSFPHISSFLFLTGLCFYPVC